MISYKNFLAEEEKKRHLNYFIVECEYCHDELFINSDEIEIHLFEPVEKEVTCYAIDSSAHTFTPKQEKIIVSSDPSKDTVTFRCCECGHTQTILKSELYAHRCNKNGNNNYSIEFTEKETEDMNTFMKEHKDCCMTHLNKPAFSTTGGQFSFNIIPTGLGDCKIIKCNACGAEKDITDTKTW